MWVVGKSREKWERADTPSSIYLLQLHPSARAVLITNAPNTLTDSETGHDGFLFYFYNHAKDLKSVGFLTSLHAETESSHMPWLYTTGTEIDFIN